MESLTEPVFDINKICRICLEEGRLISIYCSEYAISPLDMIVICTSVKIVPDNDELPSSICDNCIYRLRVAYQFKQQCENSDMRLRECLGLSDIAVPDEPLQPHIGTDSSTPLKMKKPSQTFDLGTQPMSSSTEVKDEEIYSAMSSMYIFGDSATISGNLQADDVQVDSNILMVEEQHCVNQIETEEFISSSRCRNGDGELIESEHILGTDNSLSLSESPNVGETESLLENQFLFPTGNQDANPDETNSNYLDKPLKKRLQKSKNIPKLDEKKKSPIKSDSSSCKKSKHLKIPDECKQCGKTFSYHGYLEAHMRIHTGERPFNCHLCKLKFAQAGNLALHLRVHTGERSYQCEVCSKLFTTSSNLKAHQRIHSDAKNHHCQQCDRAFRSSKELVAHSGTHTGVKDHVCTICGKAFNKVSYLNVHIRTVHVGEKRYRCSECNKEFSNSSNLNCHVRIHTGEKPFSCKYCSAKFNQSSALMRHTKQHKHGTIQADNSIDGQCEQIGALPADVPFHPDQLNGQSDVIPVHQVSLTSHEIDVDFSEDTRPVTIREQLTLTPTYTNYAKDQTDLGFPPIPDGANHLADFTRSNMLDYTKNHTLYEFSQSN